MSAWDREYYDVVRELDETQRKLRKADHDRQRYARRIRFIQARHQMLTREFSAIQKERDILKSALAACERSLQNAETKEGC